ncbi:MAG: hypothetical protein J5497_08910 [Selenomonadaceae bacterium]|nr:hypothetical protein [Selenomonadaceae bacterium]
MSKKKKTVEYDLFADFGAVDAENIVAGAVVKAAEDARNQEATKKSQRIEDFGEKIGGARKDLYAAYCDLIKVAVETEVEGVPLSKSFPSPNYKKLLESGVESWKVDAVRALRDAIPLKPRKYSWLIREWSEKVSVLRDMSVSVLENKWTAKEFSAELEKMKSSDSEYSHTLQESKEVAQKIEDSMLIYQIMGHEQDCSALTLVELGKYDYGYSDDRKFELREMHGAHRYRIMNYGATKSDAIERYKNLDHHKEKTPRTKKNPFKIYSWKYSNYYFVGCKVGREYVEIQLPFEKVEEAATYLDSHLGELEDKLEKYREIPYEREAQNTPRTGELKRTSDVTPEQFQETFGFRGVEFGTWVENKSRQENLNNTYDALMDMAEVLNLPPRALSLNGSLGLAFGARGKGGKNAPLAHYEPVKVVINLTKNKGAGSLAHEWFHGFDNYLGRKTKPSVTSMMTHDFDKNGQENISPELIDGFQLVSNVISQSGLEERCKNLDKRREKPYWTLPEEEMARAFEVYLREKLKERGIQNDYLVNYRSVESWAKATENGFRMENTYPYPSATETADIKAAFDYFFDSIRFKSHDENYEIYSAATADIRECMKNSRLLFDRELTHEQKTLQKMSEEVFGIDVKYFDGAAELHGRYDDDRDLLYLNGKTETTLDWAFWHEVFHVMKKHELELYEDILAHVERHEIFTSQQIEDYRQAVKQPKMSKSKAMEEMLADAFADMKTGRRVLEKISTENRSLADRLAAFTQKLLDGVKRFFKAKEVREKYPAVTLSSKQFKAFVTRIDENVCSMQDGKASKNSTGYKILTAVSHSPYEYAPTKQKRFDIESAKELTKKYSSDAVEQVIQDLSPLGRQNRNYGKEIVQEVRACGR